MTYRASSNNIAQYKIMQCSIMWYNKYSNGITTLLI